MDYEEMLAKARKELPSSVFEKSRFEIPKVIGHIQGNRTIISNFIQIADAFQRDINHMLKYILKELATPGEIKKSGEVIICTSVARKQAPSYGLEPDTYLLLLFIHALLHLKGGRHGTTMEKREKALLAKFTRALKTPHVPPHRSRNRRRHLSGKDSRR